MKQDTISTRPIPLFKPEKLDGDSLEETSSGKLTVIYGDCVGKEYCLSSGRMLIGRTRRCDIRVDGDSSVSRKHASIEKKDGRFLLQDLKSTNGTLVNGDLIDVRLLDHGDKIRVGRTELQFLNEVTLTEPSAVREKALEQSDLGSVESKSSERNRLKANFLGWLHKSYPGDYDRYAHQPKIGEYDIRDFLKSKGIDHAESNYLLRSWGVG